MCIHYIIQYGCACFARAKGQRYRRGAGVAVATDRRSLLGNRAACVKARRGSAAAAAAAAAAFSLAPPPPPPPPPFDNASADTGELHRDDDANEAMTAAV